VQAIAVNLVLRDRPARLNQNPESGLFSFAWDRSGEWGLNVIRTIWLGFTFLIVLAGVGAFRFAFGNFDAANASAIARPEVNYIIVAKSVQPAATISEPPPAPFVSPAPALADTVRIDNGATDTAKADAAKADAAKVNEVRDENIWPELPPHSLPALVATGSPGPDWREPSVPEPRQLNASEPRQPKSADTRQRKASEPRQKPDPKAARKAPKKETVVNKDPEATEPKTCQAEEFDALRFAFKMPTGCWS
jgi:hypothetical protein